MLKMKMNMNMNMNMNMEITVISAQGLKNPSSYLLSLFSRRLRPFITLTPYTPASTNGDKPRHVCSTRIDDHGGVDPTWGDHFHLPLDPNFFYQQTHSFIYLQIYTKRLIVGPALLGWCQIPAGDFASGMMPGGTVRHLSYRLRDRDGTRGHGVVNVAVKLDGSVPVVRPLQSGMMPEMGKCRTGTVIGIPVRMVGGQLGGGCKEDKWPASSSGPTMLGN